ncbi:MAG: hypothetical protein HYX92_11395 [Chloroflexi bacterium]|nr:hypothetical protein [Chloroflexota bacterium]
MSKELIVDPDRCTGCRVCELFCSWTKLGECNPKAAYIKVMTNEAMGMALPVIRTGCDLCGECVAWCVPQALQIVGREEAAEIRRDLRMGRFPIVRMK